MQYKQTQQAHESKKREKEYERLKQKLGQVWCRVEIFISDTDNIHMHVVTLAGFAQNSR